MTDVETKFKAALDVIHRLPDDDQYKPAPNVLLLFYGYYKQATVGPCYTPKPWSIDVANKAKWDAWNKLGDMSKETAMENYVNELKKMLDFTAQMSDREMIDALPCSDASANFVETLRKFYEIVDSDKKDEVDDKKDEMKLADNDALGQPHAATTDENKVSVDGCDLSIIGNNIKSEKNEELRDSSGDVTIVVTNDLINHLDDLLSSNTNLGAAPSKNTDHHHRHHHEESCKVLKKHPIATIIVTSTFVLAGIIVALTKSFSKNFLSIIDHCHGFANPEQTEKNLCAFCFNECL